MGVTMKALLLIGACLVSLVVGEEEKAYHGFQVLRVTVDNTEHLRIVRSLEQTNQYDFWSEARIGFTDIMAAPTKVIHLQHELEHFGLEYSVMVEDVQHLIQTEQIYSEAHLEAKKNFRLAYDMDWEDYHSLATIYEYLDYLEENFDDVSTEVIGQSYEKRDTRIISICRGGCGNKPAMWIDGGIHAREWISPATVTYLIKQLTEDMTAENEDLLENLDWYILPVANPDGYEFTRASDRLWRKTRSEYSGNLCKGTDPNRNFGFHWNEGGSSDSSCSEAYHGPEAFSEIETANIRDFLLAHKDNVKFYNNVHSYGQMVLLPYGFAENSKPDVYDDLLSLGNQMADTIASVHGTQFDVDLIPNLVGVASGGTVDWTLGVAGIKYSYGTELRDTGSYGFLLPASQIIATGEENWAMWQFVGRSIVSEFGKKH
ncbi:carboxypeptidase B-like [Tigriopus californicus]|nr:carboxypeptidase B-like [Tigriopus californicus]